MGERARRAQSSGEALHIVTEVTKRMPRKFLSENGKNLNKSSHEGWTWWAHL